MSTHDSAMAIVPGGGEIGIEHTICEMARDFPTRDQSGRATRWQPGKRFY